jgi:UDP-2,3-diacylglucosamine pyrophosphatase LpxH
MSRKRKHQRLSEVFQAAEQISFTSEDRLVFFSDLHRGDNSWADAFAQHELIYTHALGHYFDDGFTYVEVGDGDELMKFRFVETIRAAHEQVYLRLQEFHDEGRFHYIFGNHDIEYRNPQALAHKLNYYFNWSTSQPEILFNDFRVHEGLRFLHQESGVEFFVVHGHQGEFWSDQFAWLSRIVLYRLWRPLELLGFQDPASVSQNIHQRQKIELQLQDWVAQHQQPLICGHTHDERFPKPGQPPYFNIGSCVHPRWITCVEIEHGAISLVRWRIKVHKKGDLYVQRKVIGGPLEIASL